MLEKLKKPFDYFSSIMMAKGVDQRSTNVEFAQDAQKSKQNNKFFVKCSKSKFSCISSNMCGPKWSLFCCRIFTGIWELRKTLTLWDRPQPTYWGGTLFPNSVWFQFQVSYLSSVDRFWWLMMGSEISWNVVYRIFETGINKDRSAIIRIHWREFE